MRKLKTGVLPGGTRVFGIEVVKGNLGGKSKRRAAGGRRRRARR